MKMLFRKPWKRENVLRVLYCIYFLKNPSVRGTAQQKLMLHKGPLYLKTQEHLV